MQSSTEGHPKSLVDPESIMQLLQKLTRKTVSRDRLVPILSILVFAAYPGESWAADNATGQTSAEPGVSVIGISQKAPAGELPARLKAPETSPPSSGPPSSTAVPQASANQTASRAHSVAAKPVEVVPNPSAIPMSEPSPIPSSPPPLTWLGVTLYGVVDVGLAHLSHGAPASNTYGPGLPYIVQSFSRDSMTSIANNGLSQSKIGLSGVEPLAARGFSLDEHQTRLGAADARGMT